MTTCAFCSQPLGDDDRFCTGCGKAVEGGRAASPASTAVVGASPASSAATGFRWTWALLTIPIAVGTALGVAFVAGFLVAMMGLSAADGTPPAFLVPVILLGSMVVAGLIVGWFSPGRTLYEPGVGLGAAVLVTSVIFGDLGSAVLGWLLPFALGVGGAWLGEWLQGRFASR